MAEIICPNCHKAFKVDESGYAAIVSQIKDKEFEKTIKAQKKELESAQKEKIDKAVLESSQEYKDEIAELKMELQNSQNLIQQLKDDKQRSIDDAIRDTEEAIRELKRDIELNEVEYKLKLKNQKEKYETKIIEKNAEIDRIREFKLQLSTKMVGESLENYCENEFNKLRATGFKGAYFEKDNDAKTGSKGDFIFRDFIDDTEYISIMFEMKNENDETKTKHKNEHFLAELDKDRKEKGCEYAVLVSMLEQDNDLYNSGIVDMSHKYEKMYVIRPQFFIPIITLLRNAALSSAETKKELAEIQHRDIDVTTFESQLLEFKDKFGRNYELAKDHFDKAIKEIDNTIDHLNKVKEALMSSGNQLSYANNKLEDLTIKKLTKNNPTMQQKFEDAGVEIKRTRSTRKKKS